MKTLSIRGVMSNGWSDEGFTDCAALVNELNATDEDIKLDISSYGGDVEGGVSLSIALSNWADAHPDKALAVEIGAICASAAANLVARLPRRTSIRIHPESMVMYHSCSGFACGSPDEMRDAAAQMDKVNEVVIRSLTSRTTLDENTVRPWFSAGREGWLNGLDAAACGLADELIDGYMLPAPELPAEDAGEWRTKYAAIAAIATKVKNKETAMAEEEIKVVEEEKPETTEDETEKVVVVEEDKPEAECGEKPKAEDEEKIKILEEENAQLKAEIETLKATCEKLTKGLNAPSASAQPRKNFAELVREIPRNLPAKEYERRFTALKTDHKAEYDEYIAAHSKR